jgi:hypothetical protein
MYGIRVNKNMSAGNMANVKLNATALALVLISSFLKLWINTLMKSYQETSFL